MMHTLVLHKYDQDFLAFHADLHQMWMCCQPQIVCTSHHLDVIVHMLDPSKTIHKDDLLSCADRSYLH